MPEPTSTGVAAGLSIKSLIAGGIGGALALSVLSQIGPWRAAASIVGGAAGANYFGALVRHYTGVPEEFSGAVDFMIGLLFLAVLPGVMTGFQKAMSDPVGFIREVVNKKTGGDGDA